MLFENWLAVNRISTSRRVDLFENGVWQESGCVFYKLDTSVPEYVFISNKGEWYGGVVNPT